MLHCYKNYRCSTWSMEHCNITTISQAQCGHGSSDCTLHKQISSFWKENEKLKFTLTLMVHWWTRIFGVTPSFIVLTTQLYSLVTLVFGALQTLFLTLSTVLDHLKLVHKGNWNTCRTKSQSQTAQLPWTRCQCVWAQATGKTHRRTERMDPSPTFLLNASEAW